MRKTLIAVLVVATIIEIGLGIGVLFAPAAMMGSFQITNLNGDILYLAGIIGWFCLLAAAFAALAIRWLMQEKNEGRTLAILLGLFWIGIGLHLAIAFDRPTHFVLDAAKGLLILILAWRLPSGSTAVISSKNSRGDRKSTGA